MHEYIYTHKNIHTYARTHARTHARTTHTHTHTHLLTHAHTHTYTSHTYIHIHAHTYIHMHLFLSYIHKWSYSPYTHTYCGALNPPGCTTWGGTARFWKSEIQNKSRNRNQNPNGPQGLFSDSSFEKNPERWPFRILVFIPTNISSLIFSETGCMCFDSLTPSDMTHTCVYATWLNCATCLLCFVRGLAQTCISLRNTLQRTASHCNTLQHAATHCILPPFATRVALLWAGVVTKKCHSLHYTAACCNTMQHSVTYCNTLHTHCNILQHTLFKPAPRAPAFWPSSMTVTSYLFPAPKNKIYKFVKKRLVHLTVECDLCVNVYMCEQMYMFISCVYMYEYNYICVYIYIYIYICMNIQIYIYIYFNIYKHIYTYTYMHIVCI